jgi:4-amino-4-deoxy-L-arabinose transferase-like glycosyltransferase
MANQLTDTYKEANKSQNAVFLTSKQSVITMLAPLLLLTIIESSILIWTSFDKSIPCWDTAAHRLNSCYVYDLLKHPHFRHLDWYRHIFAVSPLYPPLFYIINASLKLIFGYLTNTEIASNMFFAAILFASLYYIGETTFKNRLASLIAASLVFLYPAVFWSAHCASLDFASLAMVGLGLATFSWWSEQPQPKRSLILGLVFGLALLTKNNTPIFFAGPILVDLTYALFKNRPKLDYERIKQLALSGIITTLVVLPWLVLAGPAVSQFINSIQKQNFHANSALSTPPNIAATNSQVSFLSEFLIHFHRFTLEDLPLILSPLLCICLLAAATTIKTINRSKLYLFSSLILSIIIASAFRWPHQFRYIEPAAVPAAALTAGSISLLWSNKKLIARLLLIVILAIALFQIIYDAFTPYPLKMPAWTNNIMQTFNEKFKTLSLIGQMPGISVSPLPESDSGITWALQNIESLSQNKPTNLMIMPNANPINCSPFYYLTKIRKDNIEVGSPREHTELGDKVRFNKDKAVWYQWYILKSGDQGIPFCDTESSQAYDRWSTFVRSSGLYKLFSKKILADNTSLEIYKSVSEK